jgi:hypothetical protein
VQLEEREGVVMEQSLAKTGQKDIVREGAFDLTPHSLNEAFQLAELMSKSELVPQGFRNRPADVLIAVQYGAELGLPPLQALSGICVINGRACIWGDAALAVVLKSGLMENYKEMSSEEIEKSGKAVFWCKRKGVPEPIVREFSVEDAQRAHLWDNAGKKPIWKDYPYRMLQMRARSWALRDGFADALKGVAIREELEDFQVTEAPATLAMPKRLSERTETTQTEPLPETHSEPEPEKHFVGPECPKCNGPMRFVDAGITKTGKNAGKPHEAFYGCTIKDCKGFMWAKDYKKPEPPKQEPFENGAELFPAEPGSNG